MMHPPNEYRPSRVSPPTDTLLEAWREGGLRAVLRVPLRFWIMRTIHWLNSLRGKDRENA